MLIFCLMVCWWSCFLLASSVADSSAADRFEVPPGYSIRRVAGPPLVERPITIDWDERGRLYVAESSGSNDAVTDQLEKRPHRILQLTDRDGDGVYDERTQFVEQIMFPEGTMWHDGSLYVSAPPDLWKFTDTDDDGIADRHEKWFSATLTGCANDLHGPYLGRDGWIYWCKGAFAEQTHVLPDGSRLTTRAAHIFRRHPKRDATEPVMTGGMDNPVDVVFLPNGDRIFSTTFLQHPAGGKRDGLIHAIYGGLFGKRHGVLEGHVRTGELLPPLVHLGAAAPCGLEVLDAPIWQENTEGTLLLAQFNRQRVSRHRLVRVGASYTTRDDDFLVATDRDFHPTDVREDADGSVLVVDTGGWYKLCCPTSHLWKPDILGGIYRITPRERTLPADPRGLRLDWTKALSDRDLVARIADARYAVAERAMAVAAARGVSPQTVAELYQSSSDRRLRCRCVWTWCRLDGEEGLEYLRHATSDKETDVRLAAYHALSLRRDPASRDVARRGLSDDSLQVVALAAELAGRLKDGGAVVGLLEAAERSDQPHFRHAIRYALMAIDDDTAMRRAIVHFHSPGAVQAMLIAWSQMASSSMEPGDLSKWLAHDNAAIRKTAWSVLDQRPTWSESVASQWSDRLTDDLPLPIEVSAARLAAMTRSRAMQAALSQALADATTPPDRRDLALAAMRQSDVKPVPLGWVDVLASRLRDEIGGGEETVLATIDHLSKDSFPEPWRAAVAATADDLEKPIDIRLHALAILPDLVALTDRQVDTALNNLTSPDSSVTDRARGVDLLRRVELSEDQQRRIAETFSSLNLLDLREMVELFVDRSPSVRGVVWDRLIANPAAQGLSHKMLQRIMPVEAAPSVQRWMAQHAAAGQTMRDRMERVVQLVETADARRGQTLYYSQQASCSACHALGYLGGRIGPDLSRIGRIRQPIDLVESIMLPSQSYVRSYEPWTFATHDGKTYNGLVRDETNDHVTLVLDAERMIELPIDSIAVRQPGTVSVMPEGLARQWNDQQLADLVKFLLVAQ